MNSPELNASHARAMCRACRMPPGSKEGVFVEPEGAACFVALEKLRASGEIDSSERVVIFNTGSGIKYLDVFKS